MAQSEIPNTLLHTCRIAGTGTGMQSIGGRTGKGAGRISYELLVTNGDGEIAGIDDHPF